MPHFAANLTMMFNEFEFLDRFNAAAKAGFQAVEFLFPYDYPAEVIAEKLRRSGLKQALFNMPPGDWQGGDRGLASAAGRSDEFRQSVNKAVGYGRTIGTPLLHMMAGIAACDDEQAMIAYREALKFAADATAEAGIGLVIEPINGRDMPGYFLNDFDQAADIIEALGYPNVKLQFDIYHRQVMRGDVLKALQQFISIIGHVQIAAAPARHEPGTGELNDFLVLQRLDELGYGGFVGCEYRPQGDTMAGLTWLQHFI